MDVELSSKSERIPQRTVAEDILCTDCDSEEHRTLNPVTDSVVSVTPCKKCEELREQSCKEDCGSSKKGTWVDTFQTRNKSEVPRNCSQIDLGVKNFCITTVTNTLLATENMKQLEDGRMWNKGGTIRIFALNTKSRIKAMLASMDFTTAKKLPPSLMLILLS